MYVYFIYEMPTFDVDPEIQHVVNQNHIEFVTQFKIGESKDPQSRLKNLQTGNPRQLRIYKVIKCRNKKEAQNIELAIHMLFGKSHVRGEWFDVTKDQVDSIYNRINSLLDLFKPKTVQSMSTVPQIIPPIPFISAE